MTRLLALAALSTLLGSCYLSHELGADGSVADLGARDAGPRDLGRDAPSTDAGLDLPPTFDACMPVAETGAMVGVTCDPSLAMCPVGYACVGIAGVVLAHQCEIPCSADCDCPSDTSCQTFMDKSGSRLFCLPRPVLI